MTHTKKKPYQSDPFHNRRPCIQWRTKPKHGITGPYRSQVFFPFFSSLLFFSFSFLSPSFFLSFFLSFFFFPFLPFLSYFFFVSNRPWAAQNQSVHVAIAKTPQRQSAYDSVTQCPMFSLMNLHGNPGWKPLVCKFWQMFQYKWFISMYTTWWPPGLNEIQSINVSLFLHSVVMVWILFEAL